MHDGLQLALRPVPPYLRRHSANLGHVVVLTLPRCQSFLLSGSSCSSTGLMRFSLANITTRHYCVAFSFHPDRKTLIEEPKQCRDITVVTEKAVVSDRSGVRSLSHPCFKEFLLSVDSTKLWRSTLDDFIKTYRTEVVLQDVCQVGKLPVWL